MFPVPSKKRRLIRSKGSILIVDPSIFVQFALVGMLHQAGFSDISRIRLCHSNEEALGHIKQSLAEHDEERYTLILTELEDNETQKDSI